MVERFIESQILDFEWSFLEYGNSLKHQLSCSFGSMRLFSESLRFGKMHFTIWQRPCGADKKRASSTPAAQEENGLQTLQRPKFGL